MTNKELLNLLHNLSEKDIQEMGEDVYGNPIFAIKTMDEVCSFIYGDMNLSDFPEWSEIS